MSENLRRFVRVFRAQINTTNAHVRAVYTSEIIRATDDGLSLHDYLAERVPLFYRPARDIEEDLRNNRFLTAFRRTLQRLPTHESFREAHFGEILAAIFAEELLGLRLIYSKLSHLSAENEHAKKMDLVMYDPSKTPLELVWGEVKMSPKNQVPANHDNVCYAALFRSLNSYTSTDREFDFGAAADRLTGLPTGEQERVKAALDPYAGTPLRYAGFVVIDRCTANDDEISILATRSSEKQFEVDVLGVEELGSVADTVFGNLERLVCTPSTN